MICWFSAYGNPVPTIPSTAIAATLSAVTCGVRTPETPSAIGRSLVAIAVA
jgi:hypothetical protein